MILLLLACVDLPEGWENAQPIDEFHQAACEGTPYDTGVVVTVAATAAGDMTDVVADKVQFRCAQDVEGFWQEGADGAEVLVQPIDMNPAQVAGCDCLYTLDMALPTIAEAVVVYTRGDHQSGRDTPEVIGQDTVD